MRKRDFDRFLARLRNVKGVKFVRITFASGEVMLAEPLFMKYALRGKVSVTRMPTSFLFTVSGDLNAVADSRFCPECGRSQLSCTHVRRFGVLLRLSEIKRFEAVQGLTLDQVLESLETEGVAYYRNGDNEVLSSSLSVRKNGPFYDLFDNRHGSRLGGFSVTGIVSLDEVAEHYNQVVEHGGFFLDYWDARAEEVGMRPGDLKDLLDGEVKELSRDLARLLEKSSFDLVRMADELRASLSVGGV